VPEPTSGWSGLLDELDRQLVRARRPLEVATYAPGIWEIDEICASFGTLGPVPDELVGRANSILRTYELVVTELQSTRRGIGEQLAVLQTLRGRQQPGPVYLDRVS
jgi:hypothetical protein